MKRLFAGLVGLVACVWAIQALADGRAIDGDTLELARTRIRIWGISAPELNEPGGKMAADGLAWLIKESYVTCWPTGEKSHDRIVASCDLWPLPPGEKLPDENGLGRLPYSSDNLARYLVFLGWAADCPHYSGGQYAALERAAKEAKRGIWALGYKVPEYCNVR